MFVGDAGEGEGNFLGVEHLSLIVSKGFECELRSYGEEESILAYLVKFLFDSG